MSYGYNRNSVEDAVQGFIEEYLQRGLEFIDVIEFLEENEFEVDPDEVFGQAHVELDTALQMWLDRDS